MENKINIAAYIIFDRIIERAGENISTSSTKITLMMHDIDALTVKHEFIKFLASSFKSDKNRIRLILNPKFEISAINPVVEIIVEANPISPAVYNLAARNQKTKPARLPIMEFATR
jgi:hypothetical protein